MLLALEFPDGGKGGRGKKNCLESEQFSRALMSQARLINAHAPDMAVAVISGATRFADALKVAELNRNKAKSTESRLERLRADAPDLAQQVVEETLTVGGRRRFSRPGI
ncbi:hypothetical protein GOC76_23745 [Sinorhizobium medicae]|nr:hypothetical protein [Sinorhizobium medicae]